MTHAVVGSLQGEDPRVAAEPGIALRRDVYRRIDRQRGRAEVLWAYGTT